MSLGANLLAFCTKLFLLLLNKCLIFLYEFIDSTSIEYARE